MARLAAMLVAVIALAGAAQAQNAPNCIDGLLTDEPSADRPGVIGHDAKRVYFYSGLEAGPECPAAGEKCRLKSFVVPGDKTLVAPQTVPGFACVGFINSKGRATVGWIAADAVTTVTAKEPTLADWLGEWTYYNSTIKIRRDKTPGRIALEGYSFVKRLNGMANTGEFSATVDLPKGHAFGFADRAGDTVPIERAEQYDCAVKLALVHNILVVSESGNCGGVGVNFTGFYRRQR